MLSTTESNRMVGSCGFFGGGTSMLPLPAVTSPASTRAKYMYLSPFASGGEYVGRAEYDASCAKYTPRPYIVAAEYIELQLFRQDANSYQYSLNTLPFFPAKFLLKPC